MMEEKRTLLAFALMMLLWTGYVILFPPEEPVPVQPEQPTVQTEAVTPAEAPTINPVIQPVVVPAEVDQRNVRVETDLMTITFSSLGGSIQSIQLKNYQEEATEDSPFVELFPGFTDQQVTLAFNGSGQFDISPLTGFAIQDSRSSITLSGSEKLTLTMVAQSAGGLQLAKNYSLSGDSYTIELQTVATSLSQPMQGQLGLNLVQPWDDTTETSRLTFVGPMIQEVDDKIKVKVDDVQDEKEPYTSAIQWAGFATKYFIRMVAPKDQSDFHVLLSKEPGRVNTLLQSKDIILQQGESRSLDFTLYMGPRDQEILEEAGHGFESSMEYGWFGPLAQPLLMVLKIFYGFLGNYGWAIILLTVIIKLLFWPLTQKSYTSMKAMSKLQPEMAKLREKYSKDKQRLNTEMMALYKEHRVNPMGGCLPMLIQIPVFIALYNGLMGAIELRHAPFMLWVTDLSAADTLFSDLMGLPFALGPLPLIMGFTMFLQQKMTPSTMDPTQAKIFMMMPVVFTFMFLSFPSGLVIYWMVNNILTIVQQVLIRRAE